MNKIAITFLLLSLLLWACGTDEKKPMIDKRWENEGEVLTVKLDRLKLRKEAFARAEIMDTLGIGNRVLDLEVVGEKLTLGSIDSVMHWEPWLKVETEKGLQGWVYAGGIDFSNKKNTLLEKRTIALLGKSFYKEIDAYQKKHKVILTDKDFAENYRVGVYLRDSMVAVIDAFLEELPVDTRLPDFFWLEDVMPGFIPQLVSEGTRYYLFADYRHWGQKGKESEGIADNEYIETCFARFPTDSIEYFFSAWTLQTWDYGGHSLLGRGIHLKILSLLDSCMLKNELFKPEILELKNEILDDITVDYITFWESKDKILEEVDEILAANISIVNKEDKIALEVRRMQFESANKNNIKLNILSK